MSGVNLFEDKTYSKLVALTTDSEMKDWLAEGKCVYDARLALMQNIPAVVSKKMMNKFFFVRSMKKFVLKKTIKSDKASAFI